MRPVALIAIAAVLAAACARSTTTPAAPDTTVVGQWGGVSVSLVVTPTGGTVVYDCAHGDLTAPLVLDASGDFDVPGTFVRERGGPVRDNEVPDVRPARYAGRIARGMMSLTVTRTDSAFTVGSFRLERASQGRVVKCL